MKEVYLLYDVGSDEIPQVIAVFSTKKKAENYETQLSHQEFDEYKIEKDVLDPVIKGPGYCKECGKPFEKEGKRLFCSERCRSRFHVRKSARSRKKMATEKQNAKGHNNTGE